VRLRAIVGVLCGILIERGVVGRHELMELLRDALHEIDPLMLPSLRRASAATGPLLPAGANPYRDASASVPPSERSVT